MTKYTPELFTLSTGDVLYHGTGGEDDFDIPDGPAWFSTDRRVAESFSDWHEGYNPRIKTYEVASPVELVLFHDRVDISEFFEENGLWDHENYGAGELAEELCKLGFDGWIIPNNYNPGDDILICTPFSVVKILDE